MSQSSLRDRKKERTRQALIKVALDLFESKGYDETTVADIAAAADIGTRTFFSYFASKEELLFPEVDARVNAVKSAIADRGQNDNAKDVLLRALHSVAESGGDLVGRRAELRIRMIQRVQAVRGRALHMQLDAQREIARDLLAAFPDDLNEVGAAALVGAFVGSVEGALQALIDNSTEIGPDQLRQYLAQATEIGLAFSPRPSG